MEAVIAKLEEQGTDEDVIASYKEQMTSAQRLQLENFNRAVNKYVDAIAVVWIIFDYTHYTVCSGASTLIL